MPSNSLQLTADLAETQWVQSEKCGQNLPLQI
jgi:hypothetical protein